MPPVASRIKDVESKYYVALRFSVYRDLGTTIAANPSTILAIARLGDREKATPDPRPRTTARSTRKWEIPAEVRRPLGRRTPHATPEGDGPAARSDRRADRPAPPERLLAEPAVPRQLDGRDDGGLSPGLSRIFGDRPVRDVGLIASEGRMTIPIEDGTPAGVLDIRHHYFEFIPEDQADREEPETVEAADLVEGRHYFILPTTAGGLYRYQIHDLVRCVGFHGKAPLVEFLNKGAHFSSLTGEKLSEYQVVAAATEAQTEPGAPAALVPPAAELGRSAVLYTSSSRRPTCPRRVGAERLAERRGRRARSGLNVEYENKRDDPPTRPDPHASASPTAPGPISSDGGWRGAGEPSNNISNRT